MVHSSDTPPDGDFARYIEQVNARSAAAALAREAVPASPHGRLHAPASPEAVYPAEGRGEEKLPMNAVASKPLSGASLWTFAKWLLVSWVGLQLASRWVPQLAWLVVPVWLALAAWLGYRLNKVPRGVLLLQLRERIRQAAEKFEPRK